MKSDEVTFSGQLEKVTGFGFERITFDGEELEKMVYRHLAKAGIDLATPIRVEFTIKKLDQ